MRHLLWLALCLHFSVPALAQDGSVRPETGKPLQAAQHMIKERKFSDALVKLREVEAIPNRTPTENGLLEQLRLIAAVSADQGAVAAKAFDGLAALGALAPAQRLQFSEAIAGAFFRAKDYAATVAWANRALAAGGTSETLRNLLVHAPYQAGDYAAAAKAVTEQMGAGGQVSEALLRVLADCAVQMKDTKAYGAALEKLATWYPKPEIWTELIRAVSARPGFSDRLALDAARLGLVVGSFANNSGPYVELAELALQAGLPGEAKAALDKGYAAGVLGTGQEAERHKRLSDLAAKAAAADLAGLAVAEAEAAGKDSGTALVNTGLAYLGFGQAAKAAAVMEAGIAKGGLKNPDDARLHLGIAYWAAGQKAKAQEALKAVKGSDGAADLARLWAIKTGAL
ncbi:conserved exported hypothetical protein [Candidatus Terasakiella magnetica]|nr:conserved exported hypothetical protein [Candidatus Terasakiella magnetica]